MSDTLYVFAVNAATNVRHTHLTRSQGMTPALPPLTDWLGAEVDDAEVELFSVKDLGEMSLRDYVEMAFAPEAIPPQAARRMNALKGHVLLVPERALSEEPAPGKEATLIAALPLARADHNGVLPKAGMAPMPRAVLAGGAPEARRSGSLIWLLGALALLALLIGILVT